LKHDVSRLFFEAVLNQARHARNDRTLAGRGPPPTGVYRATTRLLQPAIRSQNRG
jgi:hypothetical protein